MDCGWVEKGSYSSPAQSWPDFDIYAADGNLHGAADPAAWLLLVEPIGASVLNGDPVTQSMHRIQGGGYLMPELPLLRNTGVDGFLQVSDTAAMAMTRRLAQEEGIFFNTVVLVTLARARRR